MGCNICPRNCNTDRQNSIGYCGANDGMMIARAALHMWEEPCISGKEGSGAIFFSGCSLKCIFCQNAKISGGMKGHEVSPDELAEEMIKLQADGANNINLVTAGHYLPKVIESINKAKNMGLLIPIVYNTSGYEKLSAIKALEGLVDIYLPDHKYYSPDLAAKFSNAPNYHEVATAALDEMVRQIYSDGSTRSDGSTGGEKFDDRGIMTRGVIVRHLILPGHTKDSMEVLKFLHDRYGEKIYISIMNQYTPVIGDTKYSELRRKLTEREYEKVVDYACSIGIEKGFIQDGETARESFIPEFE